MNPTKRRQGFTLIEILVALVILVTGITMLSHMADVSMRDAEKSQDRSIVQVACQSRMNELLSGSEPIRPQMGERIEGLLNWTLWVEVRPVGRLDLVAIRVVARKHELIDGGTVLSAPIGPEYALVHWVDASRIASLYPEGMEPGATSLFGQGGSERYNATMVGPDAAGSLSGFGGPMGGSLDGFGATSSFSQAGPMGSGAIDPFPNQRDAFNSPQMRADSAPADDFSMMPPETSSSAMMNDTAMEEAMFGPRNPELLGFDDFPSSDSTGEESTGMGDGPPSATDDSLSGGSATPQRSRSGNIGSGSAAGASDRFSRDPRLNTAFGERSNTQPRNQRRDVGPIETESYDAENDFNLQLLEQSRNRP